MSDHSGKLLQIPVPALGALGTSSPPQTATPGQPIVVSDFSGKGLHDVALGHPETKDISVYLASDTTSFEPELRFAAGGAPRALLASDVNVDGYMDLLSVNSDEGTVSVLIGHGDGTFHEPHILPTTALPTALTPGSNGDGLRSVVALRELLPGSAVVVNFATSNGPLAYSPGLLPPQDDEQIAVVAGDGRESAQLLTAFTLDAPLRVVDDARLPFTDILRVNGPGLTAGVDVFSAQGWSSLEREEVVLAVGQAWRGPGGAAQAMVDVSALNSFELALVDLLRPDRLDGLPGRMPRAVAGTEGSAAVAACDGGPALLLCAEHAGPAAAAVFLTAAEQEVLLNALWSEFDSASAPQAAVRPALSPAPLPTAPEQEEQDAAPSVQAFALVLLACGLCREARKTEKEQPKATKGVS
jgi:hypothetical protein